MSEALLFVIIFSGQDWELSELTMEPLALAEGMKALEEEQMLWRPGVQVEFLAIFVGTRPISVACGMADFVTNQF